MTDLFFFLFQEDAYSNLSTNTCSLMYLSTFHSITNFYPQSFYLLITTPRPPGEAGSHLVMYMTEGALEATLYLPNETYYIEKSTKHFRRDVTAFTHIVYRASDLVYDWGGAEQHEIEGSLCAFCNH